MKICNITWSVWVVYGHHEWGVALGVDCEEILERFCFGSRHFFLWEVSKDLVEMSDVPEMCERMSEMFEVFEISQMSEMSEMKCLFCLIGLTCPKCLFAMDEMFGLKSWKYLKGLKCLKFLKFEALCFCMRISNGKCGSQWCVLSYVNYKKNKYIYIYLHTYTYIYRQYEQQTVFPWRMPELSICFFLYLFILDGKNIYIWTNTNQYRYTTTKNFTCVDMNSFTCGNTMVSICPS